MKLSIIIPVYNQEDLIIKCLDSIPKKPGIEIIVINDCSTDNTRNNITKYKANKHRREINLINLEKQHGVSYARNRGLANAKGEYILFIDSDDYIYTDVFNEIFENELKIVDIIFYDMIDNQGTRYEVNKYRAMNRVGTFKFIKKSFIDKYPKTRFKDKLQYGEDALFHESLMCKSPTFKCTEKLMYHYNFPRKGSLTDLYQGCGKDDNKSID